MLSAVEENLAEVEIGTEKIKIPLDVIEKANVVYDFDADKGVKKK